MIPSSFIQDLLNRIDIVDTISRYISLKKGGANLIGLCPFHNEKSPSFTVSPSKQFYHCFGCGTHGTAIGFLMEYSGMSFIESVKDLAQSVGMTVPEDDQKFTQEQRTEHQKKGLALSEIMSRSSDFYRTQLRETTRAIEYLKKRGLSGEVAGHFGLGYAPNEWTNLRTVFPDYTISSLLEAGLVIDKTESDGIPQKRYDRFRDRIMFPIRNIKGQIIGFGGRVLDQGEPKYLNSPETVLFQKGHELYGLFEARKAIREQGYVLVTEGYMDVVALAQLGFPQTVATLGTACTVTHIQKLFRHTDHVIFSFDGDQAGQRAARRALEACLPHLSDNKTIQFLFLPEEHDPDSYIRAFGTKAFQKQIQNALSLSQFLFQEITKKHSLDTPEGRARIQFDAKPLVQIMPNGSLRLQIIKSLAHITHTTSTEIESLFELTQLPRRTRRTPGRIDRPTPIGLERQIIRILIEHPTLIQAIDFKILPPSPSHAIEHFPLLMEFIQDNKDLAQPLNFAVFSEHLRAQSDEFNDFIAEISAKTHSDIQTSELELKDAFHKIKIQILENEQNQLIASGMKTEEEKQRYRQLMSQKERLKHLPSLENTNSR